MVMVKRRGMLENMGAICHQYSTRKKEQKDFTKQA
jgi:hypothetical protein